MAALPNGKGRSGWASDEVPAYSGKARGQAVEGHEVGGDGELGREAARERNRTAVLEEIARKLRGREGTAPADQPRSGRSGRTLEGREKFPPD